jgi:hypothetical protein
MRTTTLNAPGRSSALPGKQRVTVIGTVVVAIALALAALLGVTYLMYRDAPRTDTPGKIDNAAGIAPQYPPAAPADPDAPGANPP